MRRTTRAVLAMVAAIALMALAMMPAVTAAHAAEPLTINPTTMWDRFYYKGSFYSIGATMRDANGNNAYCIEAGVADETSYERAEPIPDSPQARKVAWLTDRYRDSHDMTTQIAIGALIHDHFELANRPLWEARREALLRERTEVGPRIDELWAEAEANVPQGMTASYTAHPGNRTGTVVAAVRNGSGALVAGVPFTLRLIGPATFDATGSGEVSGTSSDREQTFAWTAVGDGTVTVETVYSHLALRQLVSSQDFAQFGGQTTRTDAAVSFDVRSTFRPTLATEVTARSLKPGDEPRDAVMSGTADGDVWAAGAAFDAQGYYFDGLSAQDVAVPVAPDPGEGAVAFLGRLAADGHVPNAFGRARFDGPGQRVEVTATTAPDGGGNYRTRGGFGTWVWVIDRGAQDPRAAKMLDGDVVTPFAERAETHGTVTRLSVESTVTEHAAVVGSEISDRIAVSGFPDDHGAFRGDEALGFGPDRATAQVSVYWAGDRDDPERIDDYRPSGAEPPGADAHHRTIGTWRYPAVNGEIRVGGGAPDADGDPVTIIAEDPGWYVFVYAFDGDDRVEATSSRYDDAWERVRVTVSRPETPSLTTAVIPAQVGVGEPFRDAADVSGRVQEGSYVTFTAHEAVGFGRQAGAGRLLDEVRVDLDATRANQTVMSPEVRSPANGYVHWKATLWNAKGEIVDSHPLGVDGEVTEVVADARLRTRARGLGEVNGPIWDEITVSPGERDGHEVQVPQGSVVTVTLYRNTGDPADRSMVAMRRYELSDAQVRDANDGDGLTFRAGGFTATHAGEYYWVAAIEDRYGNEMDRGRYGDPDERTGVHRYATKVTHGTVAQRLDRYESSLHANSDTLTVTGWEHADGDAAVAPGQTPSGVTFRWQLWRQGDGGEDTDVMVRQDDIRPMPELPFDERAGRVAPTLEVASSEWDIAADWAPGTYYYRLHIMDEAGDTVAYLPARDPAESFEVVSLDTAVPKGRWFDAERVYDTVTVDGALPAGSTVETQLWSVGGVLGGDRQIGTTGPIPVASESSGEAVDMPAMPAPEPGRYYWKAVVVSADRPDGPIIVDGSRIEAESFEVSRVSTRASEGGNAPAEVFDVAIIEGGAPAGASISFELFRLKPGAREDEDESVARIDPVPVEEGAVEIRSASVAVAEPGSYYWRETLWDEDGSVLHVGDARVAEESLEVTEPLPSTGMSEDVVIAFVASVLAAVCGAVMLLAAQRRVQ